MNKFTLTFHYAQQERVYQNEKFEMEKFVIQKLRIISIIAIAFLVVHNLIYGNYIYSAVYATLGIVAQFLFNYILIRPIRLDIFILIGQILLHSIYPFLIYFSVSFGKEKEIDIPKQFIRASIVQMFSYSLMIGSKYYYKSFVFIYDTVLQILLYNMGTNAFLYPGNIYLILACGTAVYSTYNQELALRRLHIKKEQSITFNQNILQLFEQPWLTCYYQKGLIYPKEINEKIEQELNIKDDKTFLSFCKETRIYNDPNMSLYTKLHNILTSTEFIKFPLKITGLHKINHITFNISRYLHEDHEMLLISIKQKVNQRIVKKLKQKVNYLQNTIQLLQNNMINTFQENQKFKKKYQIYQYKINFYTIISRFLSQEYQTEVDMQSLIEQAVLANQEQMRNKQLKLVYKLDLIKQLYTMRYHLYILINKLILQSCIGANNNSIIQLTIDNSLCELDRPMIKFCIVYQGIEIPQQIIQLLDIICQRITLFKKIKFIKQVNNILEYSLYFD